MKICYQSKCATTHTQANTSSSKIPQRAKCAYTSMLYTTQAYASLNNKALQYTRNMLQTMFATNMQCSQERQGKLI